MVKLKCTPFPNRQIRVTSGFGKRNTGIAGATTFHKGIDLGAPMKNGVKETVSSVHAVDDGTVIEYTTTGPRGCQVLIQHNGYRSRYQHLQSGYAKKWGDVVKARDKIGYMGNTSTIRNMAKHLHFEILIPKAGSNVYVEVDPLEYIKEGEKNMDAADFDAMYKAKEKERAAKPGTNDLKDEAIEAKSKGITDGSRPQSYATREEVWAMLVRMLNKVGDQNG